LISYEKFFELIKYKGYSQNELIRKGYINARLLNALKNNNSITIDTLNNLCNNLECTPMDIITYSPDRRKED
jgi:DNA-binding Xre family transcriptional regulator